MRLIQLIRNMPLIIVAMGGVLASQVTAAIPLFARQTGFECSSCHHGGNYYELSAAHWVGNLNCWGIPWANGRRFPSRVW